VKSSKSPPLPIGRAARIAFDIDTVREGCCLSARFLTRQKRLDEVELEECARLDDALAEAQRLIKATVRGIMLSRINRGSRRTRAR
jgi:hypothetical protein